MDLRSLWRRRGGQPAEASSSPLGVEAAGAVEPWAGERNAAVERPSRPAWRDLAPIPPTVGSHPLVAPTVSFSHALSGHRPPPLALEPLGHDRPADAPAGVVTGLFIGHSPHTPIQDDSGGTERATVRGHTARPTDATDTAAPRPPRLAGSSASNVPAGPSAGRELAAPGSPAMAPTQRPVVARSVAGASRGAGAGMTTAPASSSAPPAGMIGRPSVAGSPATIARPAAADVASPVGTSVTPSISVSATPLEAGASATGTVARRNLGQTRRLRIGPAIGPGTLDGGDAGHDSRPADRSDASGRSPSGHDTVRDLAVGGGRPTHEAATDGPGTTASRSSPSPSAARSAAGPDASAEPGLPDAPAASTGVQRAAAVPGSAGRPVPARPIAAPRPIERAPLVGRLEVTRANRTGLTDGTAARGHAAAHDAPGPRSTVQDALAALGAGSGISTGDPRGMLGGGAAGVGGAVGAPAAIQRSAAGASQPAAPGWPIETGAATSFRDASVAGATAPAVARSVAGGIAPEPPGPAAALASGSWSAPIRQLRATAAGARRVDGQQATGGVAGRAAAVGTVVSRAAIMPSPASAQAPAQTVWRTEPASGDDGSLGPTEPVSGDAAGAALLGTIQRLAAGETVVASRPAATTATATVLRAADGGDGGGGGAAAGQSDKELDELARKLFPRLQLRLRSELLIDRERIGALVDLGR